MIELLGVGIEGERGGEWRLRRACARLERGTLTAIVARSPLDGAMLLDAVAGRRIPDEGRLWVARVPLMRETSRRVRALVREASHGTFVTHRSLLWNTLVTRGTVLGGLLRFPRQAERQAAMRALDAVGLGRRSRDPVVALSPAERAGLAVARALTRRPAALLLRDVDAALGPDGTATFLGMVRHLVRSQRLIAIAGLGTVALARAHADRVLVLVDGRLVVDTPPSELGDVHAGQPLASMVP